MTTPKSHTAIARNLRQFLSAAPNHGSRITNHGLLALNRREFLLATAGLTGLAACGPPDPSYREPEDLVVNVTSRAQWGRRRETVPLQPAARDGRVSQAREAAARHRGAREGNLPHLHANEDHLRRRTERPRPGLPVDAEESPGQDKQGRQDRRHALSAPDDEDRQGRAGGPRRQARPALRQGAGRARLRGPRPRLPQLRRLRLRPLCQRLRQRHDERHLEPRPRGRPVDSRCPRSTKTASVASAIPLADTILSMSARSTSVFARW